MAKLGQLIKEKISKELGYEAWLSRYVSIEYTSDTGEARFCCIAHKEETSSCHFNVNFGVWKCHSADCNQSGDCIDFYYWATGCKTKGEAVQKLALDLHLIRPIADAEVEAYHQRLFSSKALLQRATEMFRLRPETLKRFQIGYVSRGADKPSRFTIPIWGESDTWEDIRLYNRGATPKMTHWASGHGACRLFPLKTFWKEPSLFFMAGERDTMRATENGLPAFTVTGGEGQLPDDFSRLFRAKTIYVCFDVDAAGRKGSRQVAERLADVCKEVFLITLPGEGLPANGDYTDWCDAGHTKEEWEALVAEAERIAAAPGLSAAESDTTEPVTITFRDLQSGELYGKPLRFLAHAIGKSHGLASYQVPTEVRIDCPRSQGKLCEKCSLYRLDPAARPWSFPISYSHEQSLQMFRVSEREQNLGIRRLLGINTKCEALQISSTARQSVQHLLISPAVELAQMREECEAARTAYYHGEPITDNRDYWFSGYLQADPKTQQSVLNLRSAEPARNAIESFCLNEEVYDAIEWFQPRNGETIAAHFDTLHRVIEEDICIWDRHDLQQAVLETIYSVLEFSCGSHRIDNGWIEVLIIGDTGTGKTASAKRMMQMFNVGELISAETVSTVGLIGGIEFIDKMPFIRWGAIPRNNGGFVVLDEIDEMQKKDKDITAQLTALRSSGIAQITKIQSARAPARVRLLWITNPPEGREIASYNGACRAIGEVIRSRQDVARFTKAYAVATDSIDVQTITQPRPRQERPGVRRHFNNLAILTWSLKPEQVEFTEDAQFLLRRETAALTEAYHESIPLLEKGRAFDKLAKLSVPIAVLSGAFRINGENLTLVIDTPHVAHAIQHLQQTYDDPAMGYRRYSAIERERGRIPDEKAVEGMLQSVVRTPRLALLRYLLTQNALTRNHLEEFVGERIYAHELWSTLMANNCLTASRSLDTASKTKCFAALLERLMTAETKPNTLKKAPIRG